ncbi:Hypothetical_protein [Hexamita inflata]|uniref:Hypothetical_protein n=1 Tax=Hexamita inflata TaxID=28002 RepID=A0ABP1HNP0_9EUKA
MPQFIDSDLELSKRTITIQYENQRPEFELFEPIKQRQNFEREPKQTRLENSAAKIVRMKREFQFKTIKYQKLLNMESKIQWNRFQFVSYEVQLDDALRQKSIV